MLWLRAARQPRSRRTDQCAGQGSLWAAAYSFTPVSSWSARNAEGFKVYGAAQTPLARVLASPEVTPQTAVITAGKGAANPFALKRQVERSLKTIAALRRVRPENVNNSPPTPGPRCGGGAGRQPPPARFNSPSNPGRTTKRKDTEKLNKQSSHWVTPVMAQRITPSGNS